MDEDSGVAYLRYMSLSSNSEMDTRENSQQTGYGEDSGDSYGYTEEYYDSTQDDSYDDSSDDSYDDSTDDSYDDSTDGSYDDSSDGYYDDREMILLTMALTAITMTVPMILPMTAVLTVLMMTVLMAITMTVLMILMWMPEEMTEIPAMMTGRIMLMTMKSPGITNRESEKAVLQIFCGAAFLTGFMLYR